MQGVNFRAWTVGEAERLGVSGWVRNEDDGSVSGVIAGERAAVEAMIARLHQGPRAAKVAAVEVTGGVIALVCSPQMALPHLLRQKPSRRRKISQRPKPRRGHVRPGPSSRVFLVTWMTRGIVNASRVHEAGSIAGRQACTSY